MHGFSYIYAHQSLHIYVYKTNAYILKCLKMFICTDWKKKNIKRTKLKVYFSEYTLFLDKNLDLLIILHNYKTKVNIS